MPRIEIESLADPRLAPFRDIRNRNWTEHSGLFIAEGLPLVQELLSSNYLCQSILLDRKFQSYLESQLDPKTEVLLVDHELVEQLVGFKFHRGVLGCGCRKPAVSIQDDRLSLEPCETMVGLLGVQDPENVGGILRTCAALGIRRVLIGPGCADPLSRRALRVSMGNALKLQLYRSQSLLEDAAWLHRTFGVLRYAASPAPAGITSGDRCLSLEQVRRRQAALLLLGNEREGLPMEVLSNSDYLIRIDMCSGVDSLNVCVAAGILLHYFTRLSTLP